MKVLTLKQPWATLIAEGLKEYEFRSWKTNYRGKVLIHAGLGFDSKDLKRFASLGYEFPQGQIIAIVQIDDCIKIDDEFNKYLNSLNNIAYGNKDREGYAWKLSHVKKIKPIPLKGKLGLWNYDYEEK